MMMMPLTGCKGKHRLVENERWIILLAAGKDKS
jgi:hypothetical protein